MAEFQALDGRNDWRVKRLAGESVADQCDFEGIGSLDEMARADIPRKSDGLKICTCCWWFAPILA
jgi:hypothetical protein